MASHSEISSSSFPCFHHSCLLFRYLTCSLFFYLRDGFWSSSGRSIWSMCIATDSHLLLLLKSLIRRVTSAISAFPAFPLGICIYFFFHFTIFWYTESRLFLIFLKSFILPHVIGIYLWMISVFCSSQHRITIAMHYVCHSLYRKSHIVNPTFQHICSGTILCILHHKPGPPSCRRQFPDTLYIYSSWVLQRLQWLFRQVAFDILHYTKPTISLKLIQIE